MTQDGQQPDVGDELDRLRLALLHERSRADRAEEALAALEAGIAERAAAEAPAPAPRPARRGWRR